MGEDPRLRAAAALPSGPEQLAAVASIDVRSLDRHDRLGMLDLIERSKSAIDALEQHVYAALSDDARTGSATRSHWSPGTRCAPASPD